MHWRAAALAGIAAAGVSTAVQLALWVAFTDALPGVLWRDARLAAALVMGTGVLAPPETFDAGIVGVATAVHCALSLVYAYALCAVIARWPTGRSLAAGALSGALLYAVNMHGFATLMPWFDVARGGITFAAHVAFGVSAAAVYRRFAN